MTPLTAWFRQFYSSKLSCARKTIKLDSFLLKLSKVKDRLWDCCVLKTALNAKYLLKSVQRVCWTNVQITCIAHEKNASCCTKVESIFHVAYTMYRVTLWGLWSYCTSDGHVAWVTLRCCVLPLVILIMYMEVVRKAWNLLLFSP